MISDISANHTEATNVAALGKERWAQTGDHPHGRPGTQYGRRGHGVWLRQRARPGREQRQGGSHGRVRSESAGPGVRSVSSLQKDRGHERRFRGLGRRRPVGCPIMDPTFPRKRSLGKIPLPRLLAPMQALGRASPGSRKGRGTSCSIGKPRSAHTRTVQSCFFPGGTVRV